MNGLTLTAEAFSKLLACLDPARDRAGEKYEDLRRTLIRFFEWRGAPYPEDHADETFNRVAQKLNEGVEIRNLNGYCYEVARRVCLEAWKRDDSKRAALLEVHLQSPAAVPADDSAVERELLLDCLEQCLARLPVENQGLLLEYYQDQNHDRIDRRKILAKTLGLRREALANRAQRLRDKLEECVSRCFQKKAEI